MTEFRDFFDVENDEHLKAWAEMERNGSWPKGFFAEPDPFRHSLVQRHFGQNGDHVVGSPFDAQIPGRDPADPYERDVGV